MDGYLGFVNRKERRMFSKDLIPRWLGILVLSGMFLTGQEA